MVPYTDPTEQPDFLPGAPPRPDDTPQTAPPSHTAPAARTMVRPLPVPSTLAMRLLAPEDPDHGPAVDTVPDPQTCPTCGKPFTAPFDVRTSRLLDLALQTSEAARTLVDALEQEGQP